MTTETQKLLKVETVTIANGATTSSSVDAQKYVVQAIEFPATLTGTGVTFEVSQDNSTFVAVHSISITKQNSKVVLVGSTYNTLEGLGRYIRLASSGAEAAERTLKIYLVPR